MTSLNYGADGSIFSFIMYTLGYLKCSGKEAGVVYPSEDKKNLFNQVQEVQKNVELMEVEVAKSRNNVHMHYNLRKTL